MKNFNKIYDTMYLFVIGLSADMVSEFRELCSSLGANEDLVSSISDADVENEETVEAVLEKVENNGSVFSVYEKYDWDDTKVFRITIYSNKHSFGGDLNEKFKI